MLRTSTVCYELPPSSPLKGLKFFFKNFFCPGSRTGAGGAPGDNRLDLPQIDLNPVFPSKIIDFRLKSIPIDDASVNARLTDIIAEYET